MAVPDASWWGAWLPWMLAGTAGSATGAVTIAITHWRTDRITTAKGGRLKEAFYLDSERVIHLYRVQGGAFQSKVNKTIQKSKGMGLFANWIRGDYGVTVAEATEYIENTEAIDVIRAVIDGLEKDDYIVYVDLRSGRISPNRALRKELSPVDGERPKEVRLSGLTTLVAVRGEFNLLVGKTNEKTTLEATYSNGSGTHRIHVEIAPKGLSGVADTGPFTFTCLGRVSWNTGNGCFVLNPTAIYW